MALCFLPRSRITERMTNPIVWFTIRETPIVVACPYRVLATTMIEITIPVSASRKRYIGRFMKPL
jgi:hypothetical protein